MVVSFSAINPDTILMVETAQASKKLLVNLFHQNQPELMGFLVSKVSNIHDAEDILQDLFIKVSELDMKLSYNIEKPKSYLFTIASNMAIDYLRKKIANLPIFLRLIGAIWRMRRPLQPPLIVF